MIVDIDKKEIKIGEIRLPNVKNLTIDTLKIDQIYSIVVRYNEGPIPHVHIISKDRKIDIAVKLDKYEYFTHPGAPDRFKNKRSCIIFNNWCQLPNFEYDGNTNWKACTQEWNSHHNHSKYIITDDIVQPDYSKLNDKR